MKFLIDRCAGRRLAVFLRSLGHDVVEVTSLGPDPGDRALLETAARENRVLVTIDNDFGELIFLDRQEHHGLVRLPDVPADERIRMMAEVLDRHGRDVEGGAVVTVRGQRIRISWPPPSNSP